MLPNSEEIRIASAPDAGYDYGIVSGSGLLEFAGEWASDVFAQSPPRRIAIVSNPKVFGIYGSKVAASFERGGFEAPVWLMADGERHKNLRSLRVCLEALGRFGIGRTDAVAALGGGVVGDLAGFAAAIHLRGVRLLQIPTTLLAMIDSSVGGKTGVNADWGKNLIGAFHSPSGVLADVSTLATLPRREFKAGMCEAVKHAALAGGELFEQTRSFLERHSGTLGRSGSAGGGLARLVTAQASFKASIVAGDPFEATDRTDARSRKVLNFGHTLGHAIERALGFRRIRHGEAVGHGIRFAARLSKALDLLDSDGLNSLNDVVRRVGRLPDISFIDPETLSKAFAADKKNLSGSLEWVLLRGLGQPEIVSGEAIPAKVLSYTLSRYVQSKT
jgi:3-dehydroquinate synthase